MGAGTGIADGQRVSIYKNVMFKKSETYAGEITPQRGAASRRHPRFQQFLSSPIQGVRV